MAALPPAERGRPRGLLAPDARPVDPGALELRVVRVDLGILLECCASKQLMTVQLDCSDKSGLTLLQ